LNIIKTITITMVVIFIPRDLHQDLFDFIMLVTSPIFKTACIPNVDDLSDEGMSGVTKSVVADLPRYS
jgi:hypothetical protein